MQQRKFRAVDCDIIYLSYDEPNAEKNYADLCTKVPWAKRVHGVKGSDAAHKACAELSETDRFITIDGDNIIDPSFLNQEFDLETHEDIAWNKIINFDECVISWSAENLINGLTYGNGGIKCWPKTKVLQMRTHEHADPKNPHAQVDFCWDLQYIQMNSSYSQIINNATPQQAWRAGFREGVKMTLDRGIKTPKEDVLKLNWLNLQRLWIWQMVGADVKNGLWAILGARSGFYKTVFTDWNYVNVRDFDYLNNLWDSEFNSITDDTVLDVCLEYSQKINKDFNFPIGEPLSSSQSTFFKTVYQNPNRNLANQFVSKFFNSKEA